MSQQDKLLEQAQLLITRLERIPVDSIWARRSSGARGALIKWVERMDPPPGQARPILGDADLRRLETVVEAGFKFLEKAARERFP